MARGLVRRDRRADRRVGRHQTVQTPADTRQHSHSVTSDLHLGERAEMRSAPGPGQVSTGADHNTPGGGV